jgi:methylated-DNA-[protein]-cysteine S-methyltransferase
MHPCSHAFIIQIKGTVTMMKKFLKITPSQFGPFVIVWTPEPVIKILRIILSDPETPASEKILRLFPGIRESSCSEINRISAQVEGFLEGTPVSFDLDMISLASCPQFQQNVLIAEHRIPRGTVSTYGRIAGYLKKPGAARAVGNALATNPFPIIIPCHRAIRSDLTLGGYQGGMEMKKRLLEMEGNELHEPGQLVKPKLFY